MRLALDAMGGDYAPKETIEGAILASERLKDETTIFLIGQEDLLSPHIPENLKQKIRDQMRPMFSKIRFWMELNAVHIFACIRNRCS